MGTSSDLRSPIRSHLLSRERRPQTSTGRTSGAGCLLEKAEGRRGGVSTFASASPDTHGRVCRQRLLATRVLHSSQSRNQTQPGKPEKSMSDFLSSEAQRSGSDVTNSDSEVSESDSMKNFVASDNSPISVYSSSTTVNSSEDSFTFSHMVGNYVFLT